MIGHVGTTYARVCDEPETMPDVEGLPHALRPELLRSFKPAFLGRPKVLPYLPLSDEIMRRIIELTLNIVGHAHTGEPSERRHLCA